MIRVASHNPVSQPLAGIVIVDLTTFLSGPFCTQILADLGARVIKLEPLTGDSSRGIPPHFVGSDSAYYLGNNRNKESVAVDLKSEAGRSIAVDLISMADVVVENFRPGVCARLGLDPDVLRNVHPELVWASISGFGQDGTWRDRVAYDMIVQALSGVMSLTGEPDGDPVRLGIPSGDLVAGMFAAIGVLASLIPRQADARGRAVDVSMLDGQLTMLSYQAVYAMHSGVVPGPQGSGHDSIPTYRSFVGGDGRQLVVTANTDRMWRSLCEVLGRPELVDDPRFVDASSRLENRELLWDQLEHAFLARPAADWVDRLTEVSVPAALIQNVAEALEDARHSGREMVVDLESIRGNRIQVVGSPIKFQGADPVVHRYPPALGQDTVAVLEEFLGLSESDVQELAAAGVVGTTALGGAVSVP